MWKIIVSTVVIGAGLYATTNMCRTYLKRRKAKYIANQIIKSLEKKKGPTEHIRRLLLTHKKD